MTKKYNYRTTGYKFIPRVVYITVGLVVATLLFNLLSVGTAFAKAREEIKGIVRISHGWGGVRLKPFENMLREFEAKFPGVKVEATVVPSTDARHAQLLTAVAGGDPPDVGMLGRVALGQFIVGKAVVPLDEFIKADGLQLKDIYDSALVDGATWRGSIYALFTTHFSNQHFLFWNKELFKNVGINPDVPPKTWQELEDYALRLIRRKEGVIEAIGIDVANTGRPIVENHWRAFIANNNGYILTDDGRRVQFHEAEGIEALRWMVELTKKLVGDYRWIQQNIGLDVTGYNASFYKGKVAMIINGDWFAAYLRKEAPDLKWDVALVPYNAKNPKAKYVTEGASGAIYSIMRGAKNPKAAWELIKFLTHSDAYARFMIEEQGRPGVVPAFYRDRKDLAKTIPGWDIWIEANRICRAMPLTPVTPQIMDAIRRYQEEALLGRLSPDEAARRAAEIAQKALDTAKWE